MMGDMDATVNLKRRAACAALSLLPESGVIGLGSGSTAALFVEELAGLVRAGRALRGAPTSETTRVLAASLGIELLTDDEIVEVDVCVDGADELTESLSAIKGGGGAHTREKIINRAAKLNVIIVDESKLVKRLGERWAVPVEVLGFARPSIERKLRSLGEPRLRMTRKENGEIPFRTDNGNFVYDVNVGAFDDPAAMAESFKRIPGVVETGIFHDAIDVALVAGDSGLRRIRRREQASIVRSQRRGDPT